MSVIVHLYKLDKARPSAFVDFFYSESNIKRFTSKPGFPYFSSRGFCWQLFKEKDTKILDSVLPNKYCKYCTHTVFTICEYWFFFHLKRIKLQFNFKLFTTGLKTKYIKTINQHPFNPILMKNSNVNFNWRVYFTFEELDELDEHVNV